MSLPHILIAASRKSSGKTSISIGLTRALARQGLKVQTFKKGPDYIDPAWLQQASGNPCYNLDFNTMSDDEIHSCFSSRASGADFSLIETNKGLFDGVDLLGSDANAQLAKMLKSPIVLVIDTVGMTRGIAPLLHGYVNFDPDIKIAGVILNQTGGPRHEEKLRAAVEHYTDLKVLGAIGRNDDLEMGERHLGLITPDDYKTCLPLIDRLADAIADGVDLAAIMEVARGSKYEPIADVPLIREKPKDVRIGVVRDAAFGFYYPDDLEALAKAGAELVLFNCITDRHMPQIDGLFIGGGFPETHMRELADNETMKQEIRQAISNGLPTYAECGGMMYLCEKIIWKDEEAEMVGIIPGEAVMQTRPQGRGYASLLPLKDYPWPDRPDNAQPVHEFHYAGLRNLPNDMKYAYQVKRGYGIDGEHDGIIINNMLAGFCHFRHSNANQWAERFVEFVRSKKPVPDQNSH